VKIDVTNQILEYRECLRFIWSKSCKDIARTEGFNEGFDKLEDLDGLKKLLLRQLLNGSIPENVHPEIHAVLLSNDVRILVERPSNDGNRYWDTPLPGVLISDPEFLFKDFFDWDPLRLYDCLYALVEITKSEKFLHVVGRKALIEVQYLTFFMHEDVGVESRHSKIG